MGDGYGFCGECGKAVRMMAEIPYCSQRCKALQGKYAQGALMGGGNGGGGEGGGELMIYLGHAFKFNDSDAVWECLCGVGLTLQFVAEAGGWTGLSTNTEEIWVCTWTEERHDFWERYERWMRRTL